MQAGHIDVFSAGPCRKKPAQLCPPRPQEAEAAPALLLSLPAAHTVLHSRQSPSLFLRVRLEGVV